MYYYEVCEIGRESVKSVNASILATLIKELVNKYEKNHNLNSQHRKYYVKCKEQLELIPKKYKKIGDDEGFESDANEEDSLSGDFLNEDAQSTTSCFFVDDHVFKNNRTEITHQNSYEKDPTSLASIIGSIDSANSSGSSDTDELDIHSLTPSPISQSKIQTKLTSSYVSGVKNDKTQTKYKKEEYPIADVIFCHTEPKYPKIVAWVIKKKQPDTDYGSRLGTTGVESFSKTEHCLKVIVVKCKNSDNLKDLCSDYQEYSKRVKLDQFKSIKSKKDETHKSMVLSSTLSFTRDIKVSLSDMTIASSNLIKASELSILKPKIMASFKNDLKNSVSLNSLIKPEQTFYNRSVNHDIKTTDQSQHTSVKKTQSLMNLSKTWDTKYDTWSRNENQYKGKSSDLGDQFNLFQRTDPNGVTHIQVLKAKENRPDLTDKLIINKSKLRKEIEGVILADVESYAKKEQVRQRQYPEGGESSDKTYEAPPLRPERKKYLKKKMVAPSFEEQSEKKVSSPQQVTKPSGSFSFSIRPNENVTQEKKILRGPYVRVQSWGSQNTIDSNFNTLRPESKDRHERKNGEMCVDKRRSKSASRVPRKTPMTYRYVDVTNDYRGNPSLKCGMPQKSNINLTDIKHNVRRRKSFDDIIALDNLKGNLKSVIKKNKTINDKYCEPKKVTFSAFATVQVVD